MAELERELEAARKTLVRIVDEDCEHLFDSTNDLRLIAANALAAYRQATQTKEKTNEKAK